MTTKTQRRLDKERVAAKFIEEHHDAMVGLFRRVQMELSDELKGYPRLQRDARIASEMAYRADKAIKLPNDVLEAMDYFKFFLGSLAIIGIIRAIEQGSRRRKEHHLRLRQRLKERGPRMTTLRREALERRIKRIEERQADRDAKSKARPKA